jgi:hypothetical protein
MANTVVGFSINIDGVQNIDQLNQAIKDTEKSLKGLTVGTEEYAETSKQLAKLKAEQAGIKKQQDDLNKSFKETSGALGAYDQLSNKLNRLRKEYKDLAVSGKGSEKSTQDLLKQIQALDAQLKETDASVGQFQRNVGNYGQAFQDVAGNLGSVGQVAGQAVVGVRALGLAFKAALGPIGLIITAIGIVVGSIKAFFTSSEEGQQSLRRLQAVFGVVFNNLRDVLADLGKIFVNIFTNPVESLKAFGNAIKENITNRIVGLIEFIPQIAKSVGLLFQGEFSKAGQVATDAIAKVSLGIDKFTEKAQKGFGNVVTGLQNIISETNKEIQQQLKLSAIQDNLDKRSRAALVENAKLEQQIAEARNKVAQKDKFNNDERLKFLDEAVALETQILKNNEFIAATKLQLKKEQNSLSKSTKEDLDEEAELEANLINLKTQNLSKTRELAAQRVEALNAIKAEEEKAKNEELKAQEEVAKARQKFQEDNLKFTESAAKLNQEILNKSNKLITGLIENEFTKRRQIANESYKSELDAVQNNIDAIKKANEKRLQDAIDLYKGETEEVIAIRNEIVKEEEQIIKSFDQFRIEREKTLVTELANIKQDEVIATLDAEKAKQDAIKATSDLQKAKADEDREKLKENIETAQQYTDLAFQTISGLIQAGDEARMKRLEKDAEANAQIQSDLEERLQNATGLERRYLEQQLRAEKENAKAIAKAQEEAERDAAKKNKAIAIIQSIISTALAIAKANPNPAAMILAGITGAAQTAVIAAQPLAKGGVVGKGDDIVQFANGGRVTNRGNIKPLSNGDNVLATLKTGEIVLNQSQQRRIGYSTLKKAQIPNFANGGLVGAPTSLISNANNSIASEQMRVNLMDEMVKATNQRIDRLTVVYTATTDFEVEKGRNDKKTIKANSTF